MESDNAPSNALPISESIPLRILRTPAIASIRIARDATVDIVDFGSSSPRRYITPARSTITPIIIIIGAAGTLVKPLRLFIIRANMPISATIDPTAFARFLSSIKESAATAPAMAIIETDIHFIASLAFLAPFKECTIKDIMRLSIPTAVIPLAKLFTSKKLSSTQTPAKTAIPIDIAMIVLETSAIFCLLLILSMLTRPAINPKNANTNAPPLTISSTDSSPISLHTPTSMSKENDTLSTNALILAIFCVSEIFITATKAATRPTKPPAKRAPLSMSPTESKAASLQTPTISVIAKEMPISIPLTFAIVLSLDIFVTATKAATKPTKPPAKSAPLSICSADKLPAILQTMIINSIAIAIHFIILPASFISPE